MKNLKITTRAIHKEPQSILIEEGFHPIAARILASRSEGVDEPSSIATPSLSALDSPWLLPDIRIAADRIARAVINQEVISICADHDGDGTTSSAIIHSALRLFGLDGEKIMHHTSHRLNEGYGLSDALADRILSEFFTPTLVITADHGSSDAPRIERLAEHGIETIVTDHHLLPESGPPKAAIAVVTPAREDSEYPDKTIAGCMVAFLVMCATKTCLEQAGHLAAGQVDLRPLIAYAAIGTQSDCVSLLSKNNRAIIQQGLRQINGGALPAWELLAQRGLLPIDSQFLAFQLCPRLASPGRLDEAEPGIRFLLADSVKEAGRLFDYLTQENDVRKETQRGMMDEALSQALKQANSGRSSIVIYLPKGHSGVHGLVASRCLERFGLPTIMLSPHAGKPGVLAGSCRAPDTIHMRDALQGFSDKYPQVLKSFGGHAAAAGLKLDHCDLELFYNGIEEQVKAQEGAADLCPIILTDGSIDPQYLSLKTVDILQRLDPFGKGFELPMFEGLFTLKALRMVGKENAVHASLSVQDAAGKTIKAIWFNAIDHEGDSLDVCVGDPVRLVYTISDNVYRENRSLQLMVRHAQAA